VILCQNSLHINFYCAAALTCDFPMLKRHGQRKYIDCLIGSLPICLITAVHEHWRTVNAGTRNQIVDACR
jgi:hypothetical protein